MTGVWAGFTPLRSYHPLTWGHALNGNSLCKTKQPISPSSRGRVVNPNSVHPRIVCGPPTLRKLVCEETCVLAVALRAESE